MKKKVVKKAKVVKAKVTKRISAPAKKMTMWDSVKSFLGL